MPSRSAVILAAPMFLRVLTTPLITAMADRAKDRANVLIVPGRRFAGAVARLFPDADLRDGACRFARRSRSSGRRIRRSPIRLRCRASGGSARAIPPCASGDRSPSWAPISPAASSWPPPAQMPCLDDHASGFGGTARRCLLAPRLGKPRRASPLSAADLQDAAPKTLQPLFPAHRRGRRRHQRQPRASLRLRVDLLEVHRHRARARFGLLWACAVVAEVGIFMVFTRIFGSTSGDAVLGIAGVAAVVRWIAFPLIDRPGSAFRASSRSRACMRFRRGWCSSACRS